MNRLRGFGYERYLAISRGEIIDALEELNVKSATTKSDRDMIDVVIRLHLESQDAEDSGQTFDDRVRRLVGGHSG